MIMIPSLRLSALNTKNAFFALPARRKAVTDLGVVVDVTTLEDPLASRRSSVLSRLAPTVICSVENCSAPTVNCSSVCVSMVDFSTR